MVFNADGFSAKHVRFLFTAGYATAASFCYVFAWLCNLDANAVIGVPVGILVLLVSGALSAYYTEVFAWPVTTLWSLLVFITTVLQFAASLTPFSLGVLLLIPGLLTTPTPVQFVWQMCIFTTLAVASFLLIKHFAPTASQSATWENLQSAFLAAYFIVGGCSYLFLLTGLATTSGLDPIGLFSSPSPLRTALTAAGWGVQSRRDAQLTRYNQFEKQANNSYHGPQEDPLDTSSLL